MSLRRSSKSRLHNIDVLYNFSWFMSQRWNFHWFVPCSTQSAVLQQLKTIQPGVQCWLRITNAFQVLKTIPGTWKWQTICTHCQGGQDVIVENYPKYSNYTSEQNSVSETFFFNSFSSAVQEEIHFHICPCSHPFKKAGNLQAAHEEKANGKFPSITAVP